MIPAVVTAGGRLKGPLAEHLGVEIKALAPIKGVPVLSRVLNALEASSGVSESVVVGPVDALRETVGERASLIDEGETGIDNVRRGLAAMRGAAGDGFVLLSASDLPFLSVEAIDDLISRAPQDADLVFPILGKDAYEAVFPNSPNVWTKLKDGPLTGGSVLLVRPAAIERNAALIEKVFEARKSQLGMAKLLGINIALKFAAGRLTVAEAEARASTITGCSCRVLWDAHPHLACDLDDPADFTFAEQH
ncbi:MAG: NTP transferase domain-containing protein [Armatimonas sp.]